MEVPSERKKEVIEHEAAREESIYLLKDQANMPRLVSFLSD